MEILFAILRILFFPGLLFVAVGGLLLSGIDRKVLSRMQRRVGPPIVQPFYDFFKLMHQTSRFINAWELTTGPKRIREAQQLMSSPKSDE